MASKPPKQTSRSILQLMGDFASNAKKAFEAIIKKVWDDEESHELRILITGKTGQGKSTLTNGILGSKVAKEGARSARCTTEVDMFAKIIGDVPVKVFDSPGLQDRTENEEEYIRGMSEKCKELSLVLYCTKMGNTRLADDDKNAMIKLTAAFGESFWDYAVFVLTFANMENASRRDDRDQDKGEEPPNDDYKAWDDLKKQRFQHRVDLWRKDLQTFLINDVGISAKIANEIPVVPTGDHKKKRGNKYPFRLPDRDNWFNEFWEVCCLRVKETKLFLEINSERLSFGEVKDDTQVKEELNDAPHRRRSISSSEVMPGAQPLLRSATLPTRSVSRPESIIFEDGDLYNQPIPLSDEFVEKFTMKSATKLYGAEATEEQMHTINETFHTKIKNRVEWFKGLFSRKKTE